MANPQAKIITPEKIQELRYPLPKSWTEAIGILKKKAVHPLRYQRQTRKDWEKRLEKLIK